MSWGERVILVGAWCLIALIGLIRELLGGGAYTDFFQAWSWVQWVASLFFKLVVLGLFLVNFKKLTMGRDRIATCLIIASVVIAIPGRLYHQFGETVAFIISGVILAFSLASLFLIATRRQ